MESGVGPVLASSCQTVQHMPGEKMDDGHDDDDDENDNDDVRFLQHI